MWGPAPSPSRELEAVLHQEEGVNQGRRAVEGGRVLPAEGQGLLEGGQGEAGVPARHPAEETARSQPGSCAVLNK